MSNLYAERDIIEQGKHYSQHTSAMTSEGLHSKSDIAAELAHRDIEIERLQARVANLTSAMQEAAESYEGEFGRDIPDTWQQALDGQCSQPDMCLDYEGRIDRFGDINSVAYGFADGLDPGGDV